MFKASEALVSDDGHFVYLKKKNGAGYFTFINYQSVLDGLPAHIRTEALENAQLNAKIELLDYVRKQNDRNRH